jgi:tellurite resistance protein TehA-like permease
MSVWGDLRRALNRTVAAVPPGAGAVVMGTGIVSVALSLGHFELLSLILLVVCACVWVALGLLLATRAIGSHPQFNDEVRSPAALTGVAGTAVLGARLVTLGWDWAGQALLVVAFVFWLGLLVPVLAHWKRPTIGTSFVLVVSTESLAVLAAVLATREHVGWLVGAAVVELVLGLFLYVFVLASFDFRQLAIGYGDHWVAGGALAISTLAAGRLTVAAEGVASFSSLGSVLATGALVLWGLSIAWLPALLVFEAIRPRTGYDTRRWSTVFPFGMYAACSFVVGSAAGVATIRTFAQIWVWVAVALWLVVFSAMIERGLSLLRANYTSGQIAN